MPHIEGPLARPGQNEDDTGSDVLKHVLMGEDVPEGQIDLDPADPLDDFLAASEFQEKDIPEPTEEELEEVASLFSSDADEAKAQEELDNFDPEDIVGQYLKEIAKIPLLNAEEEVAIAKRMEKGTSGREELAHAGGNVGKKREHQLRGLIEDGNAARQSLITANTRLVVSVAKKYMGRGMPFLDMIQEGNIGLMRATKKFDYHRGHKFSTYATWWIRQAIARNISERAHTIRVPVHLGDQINKMLSARHKLTQAFGREPTVDELAQNLDVSTKKIRQMMSVSFWPLSLDLPTDDEESSVLGDFIEDETSPNPHDEATYHILQELIKDSLGSLPTREATILQLRYGLFDGIPYTLEKIGEKLDLTRERVRQIESQALSRLRHRESRVKLRDFLDKEHPER